MEETFMINIDIGPEINTAGPPHTKGGSTERPFDAHCCHTGTATKHPVPDRVKPYIIVFFDIRAL